MYSLKYMLRSWPSRSVRRRRELPPYERDDRDLITILGEARTAADRRMEIHLGGFRRY